MLVLIYLCEIKVPKSIKLQNDIHSTHEKVAAF